MRPWLHLAAQAALWAIAPMLDETGAIESPSLLVMPMSAALAAWGSPSWRAAGAAPVLGLLVVLAGFSAWTIGIGRTTVGEAFGFGLGMLPFHVLGTWALTAVCWWPVRRLAGRGAHEPVARRSVRALRR